MALRLSEAMGGLTMFGTRVACAVALERNPAVGPAITAEGHDVLGHGNR